jgi:hypothetical protein
MFVPPSSPIWIKACTLPGNTNSRGRLNTVDLLTRVACFVKKKIIFSISKGAELK